MLKRALEVSEEGWGVWSAKLLASERVTTGLETLFSSAIQAKETFDKGVRQALREPALEGRRRLAEAEARRARVDDRRPRREGGARGPSGRRRPRVACGGSPSSTRRAATEDHALRECGGAPRRAWSARARRGPRHPGPRGQVARRRRAGSPRRSASSSASCRSRRSPYVRRSPAWSSCPRTRSSPRSRSWWRRRRMRRAPRARLDAIPAGACDVVLMDAPPSVSLVTENVLVAAREVVVPVALTYLALDGCAEMVQASTLRAARGRAPALTLDRADALPEDPARRRDPREAPGAVPGRALGDGARLVGQDRRGAEPRRTIFEYAPRSTGAQAIAAISDEIRSRAPAALGCSEFPGPSQASETSSARRDDRACP